MLFGREDEKVLTGSEPSDSTGSNTNGNGQVTIREAKAAGFSMPITSDHWLNIGNNS